MKDNKTAQNVQSTKTGTEATKTTAAPAAQVTETDAIASTDRNASGDAPAAGAAVAEAPVVVNGAAAAVKEEVKTRLFWQKACNDVKQSTNTVIKPDEVFVLTDRKVWALPDGKKPQNTTDNAPVEVPVYSLKRGKRIYYTFYVNPDQIAAATKAGQAKAEAKAAADKIKADEKAKKDAEKAAKAGNTAGAIQPAAGAVAAPAASAAPAEQISEEELGK